MNESPSESIAPKETGAIKSSPKTASFPAKFESLDDVRDFVGHEAHASGLDGAAVYAVQMAVDEAFSNIVEHAYGEGSREDVVCICQATDFGLIVSLRDYGQPFNPLGVPDPDLESDLEDRQIGGLGLYFMRQLMDEVNFTFVPKSKTERAHNVLTMVKRKGNKKNTGGST